MVIKVGDGNNMNQFYFSLLYVEQWGFYLQETIPELYIVDKERKINLS